MYESQRNDPWHEGISGIAARTVGEPTRTRSEQYTWSHAAPTYTHEPAVTADFAPQTAAAQLWYADPTLIAEPVAQTGPSDPAAVLYPMRNKAGTAALVLGVIALVCTSIAFVLFPLGIIAGVWAIVLGRRGRFRAQYGFASNGSAAATGLGLGVIALLLGMLLSAGTAWVATSYDVADFGDCITASTDTGGALRCAADVIDAG